MGVEKRTLRVTLLSSEWRSSTNGDVSTINRELAIQLAKHPDVQVSVFLPQCSEEDKNSANNHKVQLIEAEKMTGVDPVDWLSNVPQHHSMDCIIGHMEYILVDKYHSLKDNIIIANGFRLFTLPLKNMECTKAFLMVSRCTK